MNNSDSNDVGGATDAELEKVASFQWGKLLRVFKVRIPLWVIAIVVVIWGGWIGYMRFSTDNPVHLRPAITDAKKVSIEIFTCDKQIDEHNINIRQEELRLQNSFQNTENVASANVRITRDQKLCAKSETNQ